MITLRPANRDELEIFDAMDRQDHVQSFLVLLGLTKHQAFFDHPDITYLTIENDASACCGYFTIVQEPENHSVEIRRILVDRDKRGIGQYAIGAAERWCKDRYGMGRIWLDVFDDNARGRHIYNKLGYTWFKTETIRGRELHFLEKFL
jgi:RimJ/RimL family protein N-acetyltransferase